MVLVNAMASHARLPRDSVEPRLQRQLRVLTATTLPDLLCELDALAELLLRLRQDAAPAEVGGGAPTAGAGRCTCGASKAPVDEVVAPADGDANPAHAVPVPARDL